MAYLGTAIKEFTAAPQVPNSIQAIGPVFNMVDFRLFHHFIQAAYPYHPIGNDSVWMHDIPSIASNVSHAIEKNYAKGTN